MYCTKDDITSKRIPERTLIQLTDDAGTGSVDEAMLSEVLAEVSDTVDGYIRGAVTLPLAPVPPLVRSLALDLATYRLYARRVTGELPEKIKDMHDAAIKRLKDIQAGKLQLADTAIQKKGRARFYAI